MEAMSIRYTNANGMEIIAKTIISMCAIFHR